MVLIYPQLNHGALLQRSRLLLAWHMGPQPFDHPPDPLPGRKGEKKRATGGTPVAPGPDKSVRRTPDSFGGHTPKPQIAGLSTLGAKPSPGASCPAV